MRTLYIAAMSLFLLAVTAAAGEKAVPNRVADMKQGEWVLMEDVSPESDGETIRVTVTRVGGGKFTLRRDHMDKTGAITETKESEMDVADAAKRLDDLGKKARTVTDEMIIVNEREIPVVAIEWEGSKKDADGNSHEYKMWLSEKLPVTGVAKFWSSDNSIPHAEIIDYGFFSTK